MSEVCRNDKFFASINDCAAVQNGHFLFLVTEMCVIFHFAAWLQVFYIRAKERSHRRPHQMGSLAGGGRCSPGCVHAHAGKIRGRESHFHRIQRKPSPHGKGPVGFRPGHLRIPFPDASGGILPRRFARFLAFLPFFAAFHRRRVTDDRIF